MPPICYLCLRMDYLWTPWRYAYVTTAGTRPGAFSARLPQVEDDEKTLIVHRGRHCYVVLNTYPYTTGHVMVVPYAHLDEFQKLSGGACRRNDGANPANRASPAPILQSRRALTSGMNIGQAAGAGVAGHIHMHVLPRWVADANFMSVVGETRILPETLETTYQRIQGALKTENGETGTKN